jgi:DNA polymerase-1
MVTEALADIGGILEARDEKTKRKQRRAKEGVETKVVKKLTKKEQQIAELANNTVLPDHYSTVWTEADLAELCDWIGKQKMLAVDTETLGVNPWMDEIVGISFYAPHKGYYIPLKHIEDIGLEGLVPVVHPPESTARATVGIDYVQCLPKELVAAMLKPL